MRRAQQAEGFEKCAVHRKVLDEMRHALLPGHFVRRSHAIGKVARYDRARIVFDYRNLEAIGEAIVLEGEGPRE